MERRNETSITINDILRHVHVLVNAKVVSVLKVTWYVFCFVVAKIDAKTNELYNYSRHATHLFNKSYLILLCLQVFLCFQIFLIYFVKKKERKRLLLPLSILQFRVKLRIFSSHTTQHLYLNCLLILQKDSFFWFSKHFSCVSSKCTLVKFKGRQDQKTAWNINGMNLKITAAIKIKRWTLMETSLFQSITFVF